MATPVSTPVVTRSTYLPPVVAHPAYILPAEWANERKGELPISGDLSLTLGYRNAVSIPTLSSVARGTGF